MNPSPAAEVATAADELTSSSRTWRAFRRNPLGMGSAVLLLALILVALAAPLIAEYPRGYGHEILSPPSAAHWFGTDDVGQDVFAQVVWGTRISMTIGLAAALLAIVIGLLVGVLAAYFRALDTLLGIVIDLFLSLPVLPLMILIAALAGPSVTTLVVVIAIFSWPEVARLVRSAAMAIVPLPYVSAAKVIGGSPWWIMRRHVLPGVAPVVAISVVLTTSRAVLSEAGLSFLGLGDPNTWSWGTILHRAQQSGSLATAWWSTLFPSLAILLLVVATTLVSVAYNDARNPRTR
ncbi:ABC transporter permease [Allonocardiopsis opalescens]|uniref:Peptide/nickel transport system permease protein n=1 Tax=Allonocardiopsis opalescens TaxID=1144618 RepID=A0A2T0Q0G1_9ACTN|nr:ABC transporter permease [Allonocardiopsis opalescens]PRX97279.1 peptide/nickel transport system permease protein [Allonocardiopsis opalescens]